MAPSWRLGGPKIALDQAADVAAEIAFMLVISTGEGLQIKRLRDAHSGGDQAITDRGFEAAFFTAVLRRRGGLNGSWHVFVSLAVGSHQ